MDDSLKAAFLESLQAADFSRYLEPGPELERLTSDFSPLKVKKGSKILGSGRTSKSFVLLGSGRVSLWKLTSGRKKKVGEIDEHGYFGHDSILSGNVRKVTYIAEEDSLLFFLRKPSFLSLCNSHPDLKKFLEEISSFREESVAGSTSINAAPKERSAVTVETIPDNVGKSPLKAALHGRMPDENMEETASEMLLRAYTGSNDGEDSTTHPEVASSSCGEIFPATAVDAGAINSDNIIGDAGARAEA